MSLPKTEIGSSPEVKKLSEDKKEDKKEVKKEITRTLLPLYKFQWVDCLDTDGTWLVAQIIELDYTPDFTKLRGARIHYMGYHKQYDETLPIGSPRLAPLYSKCQRPAGGVNPTDVGVGASFDIMMPTGKSYRLCAVKEIETKGDRDRVALVEYQPETTEWINVDSPRLYPKHTFTIETVALRKIEMGRTATESQEDKWRKELKEKKGWEIVIQQGDGACLFRSVAHQVYGDANLHLLVRQKVCEYMESERNFFSSFTPVAFETYIRDLKKPNAWGDHIEIQAMSEIYDRPIEVYAFQLEPMQTYQGAPTHNAPLRLSYHYKSHYNSLIDPTTHHKQLLTTKPGEIEDLQIQESKKRGGKRADFQITDQHKKHMSDMDEAIYRSLNPDLEFPPLDSKFGTPSKTPVFQTSFSSPYDKKQEGSGFQPYMSPDNSSHPNYKPPTSPPQTNGMERVFGGGRGRGTPTSQPAVTGPGGGGGAGRGGTGRGGKTVDQMDDLEKAIHFSLLEEEQRVTGTLSQWTCDTCTFINPPAVQNQCTLCQTPRPVNSTTTTTTSGHSTTTTTNDVKITTNDVKATTTDVKATTPTTSTSDSKMTETVTPTTTTGTSTSDSKMTETSPSSSSSNSSSDSSSSSSSDSSSSNSTSDSNSSSSSSNSSSSDSSSSSSSSSDSSSSSSSSSSSTTSESQPTTTTSDAKMSDIPLPLSNKPSSPTKTAGEKRHRDTTDEQRENKKQTNNRDEYVSTDDENGPNKRVKREVSESESSSDNSNHRSEEGKVSDDASMIVDNTPLPTTSSSTSSTVPVKPATDVPGPMKHCHEMLGFSLHKCEVAYNVALADLTRNTNEEPRPEAVIQAMTTLLLQD